MRSLIKRPFSYVRYHGLLRSLSYLPRFASFYGHRAIGRQEYVLRKVNKSYKMLLGVKDEGISKELYVYGKREHDQVAIVREALKDGMKVLDIGANIGYYALLEASMVGDRGKVFAFEPHPDNFKTLVKNVEANNFSGRIELNPMGVSDKDGRLNFFVAKKSNQHTLNPERRREEGRDDSFKDTIEIGVRDITRILKETRRIDFIRMDIEGHEIEVLRGLFRASRYLPRPMPAVLFETHFRTYDGAERNEGIKTALEKLFSIGYTVEALTSTKEPVNSLRIMGYKPEKVLKTNQTYKGIYKDVSNIDALHCICDIGGIRSAFLKHHPPVMSAKADIHGFGAFAGMTVKVEE